MIRSTGRDLAVAGAGVVGLSERVLGEGAGLGAELEELLVDEGELDGAGGEPAVGHAAVVVHVKVDRHEVLAQGPEDVEHAPLLGVDEVEVQLPRYLVDELQLLHREVLEAGVLAALAVDLEEDVLLEEAVELDHVEERVELLLGLLGGGPHADEVEAVVALVGATGRDGGVGAVVHVVGHRVQG